MSDSVNISRRASSISKAPLFEPYSKVIIHAGLNSAGESEITYTAGDDTGRTLEVNNEWGSQTMAANILERIKGYQYQPLDAKGALVDPSVELGDGITANGIYSGIFVQATTFGPLMASDVSAPVDEEIEHEYGFESKTNRAYTRMVAQTRSGITQNAEEIAAEVARLEEYIDDENEAQTIELESKITQTATSIKATVAASQKQYDTSAYTVTLYGFGTPDDAGYDASDYSGKYYLDQSNGYLYLSNGSSWSVADTLALITTEQQSAIEANSSAISAKVSKTGGTNSSFGWVMNDSSHTWYANNEEIMKLQQSGLSIKGKIEATSGYIGNSSSGFTISATSLYNGMTSLSDTTHNGVYIGTDGIALGRGNFKVTSAGAITATSGTIGGFTLTGSSIYKTKTSLTSTSTGVYIGTDGIALGAYNSTNGSSAFQVTSAGVLTARSGTVGGFTLSATSLYNGMTSLTDTSHNGVYIGTNGIALGKGAFKVTSAGALTATSGTIGGFTIGTSSIYSTSNSGFYLNSSAGTLRIGKFQVASDGTINMLSSASDSASTNMSIYPSYGSYGAVMSGGSYTGGTIYGDYTSVNGTVKGYDTTYDLSAYGTGSAYGYDYNTLTASTYQYVNNLVAYWLGMYRDGTYYYFTPQYITINGTQYCIPAIASD